MLKFCIDSIRLTISTLLTTIYLFAFYLLLIPLFLGLWQDLLDEFSLGILWTCILFSFLSDNIMVDDWNDGSLDYYYLSKYSLTVVFLLKLLSNWLLKLTGIFCGYLLLCILYNLKPSLVISLSLVLGTLIFQLISATHSLMPIGLQMKTGKTSIQYLTTLPTLLPLLLLCVTKQTQHYHMIYLSGLLLLYLLLYIVLSEKMFGIVLSK